MMSLLGPWVLVLSWVVPAGTADRTESGGQPPKSTPPVEQKGFPVKASPPVALPVAQQPAPIVVPPPPSKPGAPVVTLPAPQPAAPIAPVAPAVDQKEAAAVAPPSLEKLSPDQLRRGPSLFETGRVGKMGVTESRAPIRQDRGQSMPNELLIEHKIDRGEKAAPVNAGIINAAVLKQEIKSRFALLKNCPLEVSRTRRTPLGSINANRLTLRWTILPGGKVGATQVVAISPTNGHVMDCVKREMSQWSFSPPKGGPVQVERPFKFRSMAAPAEQGTASDPD